MRMLLFIFALALIFQTPLFAVCPDEDLSGDCKVNSVDLRIFANDWLAEGQVFIESAGLVVMEAEHYTAKKAASGPLISCQWYEVSGDGSVGDGYMQTLPDDQKSADGSEILAYSPSLSYSINFTTSGLYYLWVKGFALDGTDDSFHYGLDGQPFSSDRYNCGSILQSAQGIFDWRSKKGDETRLTVMIQSPGVHTLDIWMREDGARIDRLLLTTQEGYSPSSPSESSGFSKSSADIYEDGLVNFLDFVFFAAQWLNESGPVIISEFMADNETTLADQDGLYSDWIEIVNLSDFTVNMADWYLTDDPEELDKWTFPDIEIPPAGYLIIFASGNHDEEHPLHTNFKLDNDGEYLALVMPDGSIAHQYNEYYRHDTDEFGFPPQSDDISYGIAFGSDLKVFFSTPTPNEINVEGEGVKIEPPQFSKPDAFFTDSFNLQLETSSELATIYYTLDGSEPDIGCPVYSSSIPISSTTVVRAKAFEPGYSWWSDGITKRYVKLDSDIQNFNSNLPIVVIDTFGQSPSKTEQILILATIIDTNEAGRASITEEPDFTGTVGFRIRGSSSASSSVPKYQYTFEICDQNFQDVDATFLDFPEESDFILQGPYTDKSLMRNVLTYQWGQDMGNYGGVRTRYVEAFMNTNGDDSIRMGDFATVSPTLPYNYNGDYIGAYILMEKIKRDKNRVNITKISSLDNVEPEVTGGYIIKHDRMDPEDTGFFTSRGNPYDPNPLLALCYVEPKEIEITPQQSAWLIGYLDAFEDAIYGPDPYNPDTGYPKYIDVPTLIDQYILFQITKEPDALRLSTFYYKDRGGKLKAGPAWDFNIALGNCNYGGDYTGWKFYGAWPYLFLADIEFQISFADRWFELREHVISTSKIMSDIDGYALLLNEAQIRNFQRWPYLLGYYVWPNVDGYAQRDTYQKEVDYLKNWLQLRMPHFDGLVANDFAQYPPDIFVNGTKENIGKQITTSDSISMTANSSGTIYYTTDGSDPRVKAEGSSTVLVEETAAKKVLVPASNINDNWKGGGSFDDSYWTHGLPTIPGKTGGVGYETRPGDSTNFVNYITYDVESEMDDTNPGCYIRIPFTLEPAQIDGCTQMSLSMRYDDGFIAYINGTEVASVYAPSNPQYNSAATGQHGDSGAILFQNFDISSHIGLLHSGENILAIHGLNVYSGSSDFLASAVLSVSKSQGIPGAISPTAIQYTGPITLNQSTELKARTKDGSNWSALNRTTCAIGPVKENLRITELMYHPLDPNKDNPDIELAEYIELKNISGTALNIGLAKFTEGVQFTFPQGTIIPEDGYLILAKDPTIFTNTYGQLPLGVELLSSYLGYLDNSGERIKLEDPIGQTILDFEYKDSWRTITDGDGFSLTIINPANADVNSWSKKDSWRSSARIYGSAGDDDSSLTHNPGDIVINELLAHSHDIAPDWIELYNTTPSSIDISGWYLSDSDSDDPNIKKYKIPHSTNIPANGYVVFYEDTQFGNPSDPCCLKPFALSENGETAYLRSGLDANGFLTGYKEKESFGASDEGVSFGRYEKSTGTYNFVAMQYPTPGTLNSDPNVGPIVINEIMYNPSLFDQDAEYIELHNITAGNIDLYDELGLRWKFTDGIDFTFPSNTSISANGFVVIAKNPTVFTSTYGSLPGGAVLFGPYDGQLSNGGEKLELSKPGDTDELGKRYYIRIDRVSYSDGSHHEDFDANDPWPIGCDGTGLSLSKKTSSDYGNDPIAWESSAPSPGQQNP